MDDKKRDTSKDQAINQNATGFQFGTAEYFKKRDESGNSRLVPG